MAQVQSCTKQKKLEKSTAAKQKELKSDILFNKGFGTLYGLLGSTIAAITVAEAHTYPFKANKSGYVLVFTTIAGMAFLTSLMIKKVSSSTELLRREIIEPDKSV